MISVLPKLAARTRDEQGMRIWALPVGLSRLLTPLVRASHIVCKRNLIVFGIEHLAFFAGRDQTIELDEWFSRPERMSAKDTPARRPIELAIRLRDHQTWR